MVRSFTSGEIAIFLWSHAFKTMLLGEKWMFCTHIVEVPCLRSGIS